MSTSVTNDEMAEDDAGFDPREILSGLLRRWRMILAIIVLITAAAIAYAVTIPNYYTASATLQIDRRDKKITHIDGVLSDLKADTPTLESEVEILASPTTALRVIERLKLRQDTEFDRTALLDTLPLPPEGSQVRPATPPAPEAMQPQSGAGITFPGHTDHTQTTLSRDRVVQNVLGQLQVRRLRNSLVIEVSFTSADPVKAARIANTFVDVYIENQYHEKLRATQIAIKMIDDRLTGLRDRLAATERDIAVFKSENGIIEARGHGLQDQQLSSELEVLLTVRNEAAQARSRYQQAVRLAASGAPPEAFTEVIQSDAARQLRSSLSAALRRQAELATRYGPLHPEMKKTEADVSKSRSELRQELQKAIHKLKVEFEVAAERETHMQRQFDAIKGRATTTRAQQWKLHDLEREAKAAHQLYEVLLSRKKQAEETLGMHFPDAKYVSRAEVPLQASFPKRKNIVLVAFAAAITLAFGLAILLDQIAGGITTPDRIEREFTLPHLASIPLLPRQGQGLNTPLAALRMMLTHPNGIYAEAVREIQYELDWRHHHRGPRIILVTSAVPGEGKSLLASNLAHNLAMTGRQTLLIDADMRKQTLTRILGADGRSGLFEALCKGYPVANALLQDDLTGLSFMPAAAVATTGAPPAEILASRHTQTLLAKLKMSYDTIIIDAPPLLPVIDARILAGQADQIVVTMNWQSTPKRSVHRALRAIARHVPKIAGIVLNGTAATEMKSQLTYHSTFIPRVPTATRKAA